MTSNQHSKMDGKLSQEIRLKFNHLWHLVGNTPMLEINYSFKGKNRKLYVKCEHYNLTGSIKDRMALYILQEAYRHGAIKQGDTIVEATSGNTGIAFAAIGKALGHDVHIIMPNWLSAERVNIIKSLGAKITLVSKEEGGFLGSIAIAEKLATNDPKVFLPRQFDNNYNVEAHRTTTGPEIIKQLNRIGYTPDAFVAGVGTGGTIMGVAGFLKSSKNSILLKAIEPAESPTLSTGYKVGSHRIQGISDEFIPNIMVLNELDGIIKVNDGDAILMAQKLASSLGLAVGISSGANVIGAIKISEELGNDASIVTILCDSNKKYLSTDLMKEEPVKENYITPEVKLFDYTPISRLADTGAVPFAMSDAVN